MDSRLFRLLGRVWSRDNPEDISESSDDYKT